MPFVRGLKDIVAKYQVKYDGEIVTARWTQLGDLPFIRYQAGSAPIYNAVETARIVLADLGVPIGLHGPYFAFTQELAKLMFSHRGVALQKAIGGLKAKYKIAFGLSEEVLDSIVEMILGSVPPY
ncbi:MAG: hypothetical protein QXG48_03445 [Thermofilaceae archaeon]